MPIWSRVRLLPALQSGNNWLQGLPSGAMHVRSERILHSKLVLLNCIQPWRQRRQIDRTAVQPSAGTVLHHEAKFQKNALPQSSRSEKKTKQIARNIFGATDRSCGYVEKSQFKSPVRWRRYPPPQRLLLVTSDLTPQRDGHPHRTTGTVIVCAVLPGPTVFRKAANCQTIFCSQFRNEFHLFGIVSRYLKWNKIKNVLLNI
jgi:hypothetical protein